MRILDADAARTHVDGLVHLDTQRASAGLDLTVDEVARVAGAGALDFGGSEFEPAALEAMTPRLASPDDDYGWWQLEGGSYVVRYNESLKLDDGRLARIYALPRLLRAGAFHPAFVAGNGDDPLETLLRVGRGGCRLKENCRVSRLLIVEAR